MYIPKVFEGNQKQALQLIKNNPFAIVTAQTPKGLRSVHVPFIVVDNDNGLLLQTHVAKLNEITESLFGQELLIHFSGPAAYISPHWYRESNHFPTWIYCSVHVYGKARQLNPDELNTQLLELIEDNEMRENPDNPWQLSVMPEEVTSHLKKMIMGIEIKVDRLESCFKLNQHKDIEDIKQLSKIIRQQKNQSNEDLADYIIQEKDLISNNKIEEYLDKYTMVKK